jgi:hypothetical protein
MATKPTLFEMLGSSMDKLEGDELIAAFLEPSDDLSNQRALNAVRLENGINVGRDLGSLRLYLDHNIGTFLSRHGVRWKRDVTAGCQLILLIALIDLAIDKQRQTAVSEFIHYHAWSSRRLPRAPHSLVSHFKQVIHPSSQMVCWRFSLPPVWPLVR